MFIYSVRASTLKFFAAMLTGIAALVALIIFIPTVEKDTAEPVGTEMTIKYDGVKTNEDRLAFLAQFGWQVEETPAEEKTVTIPSEFDTVFTGYNEMQKNQGLDLAPYAKCEVTQYTYVVKNYTDWDGLVYANMLVYKDTVIGGDVTSADMHGFSHGFAKPEKKDG
ncbi:MAG: DUF4830 domain-containing protein [Clostridia bacterium]|nr:DUF4830 domain-containing protein [Clostridia bacterium]